MKKSFKRLSEKIGISGDEFTNRGILDPSIKGDTKLFIDPRLLKKSEFELFRIDAQKEYKEYYEILAQCVKKVLKTDDLGTKNKMKKQLIAYLKADELDGLCLGYAEEGNPGAGVGEKYARAIMENTLELYENYEDGENIVFSLLHLLTPGIGADYIGDITAKIIKKQIYQFTEIKAKELNIETEKFDKLIDGEVFELPVYPNPPKLKRKRRIPILLVPRDILSDLPVDANMEDIFEGFLSDNDIIRQGVNNNINNILKSEEDKKTKQSKILEYIKKDKNIAEILGDFVIKAESEAYDFDNDKKSLFLRDKLFALINAYDYITEEQNHMKVIDYIIRKFEKLINNDNNLKRELLWNDSKHKKESAWQKVFHLFIGEILELSNIDVTPESETKSGPVDFKFSHGSKMRVLAELKLSTNSPVDGLVSQLEKYKSCTDSLKKAYFICFNVHKKKTSGEIFSELSQKRQELNLDTEIIVMDGRINLSASKLKQTKLLQISML